MGILRLLLALVVVINHAGHSLRLNNLFADAFVMDGNTAVQAFFIISGFYMALILNEKYNFPGSTKLFYQQRFLRLAPTYWLVILLVLLSCTVYSLYAHDARGKFIPWAQAGAFSPGTLAALVFSQLTMLGIDVFSFCQMAGHPAHLQFVLHPYQSGGLPADTFTLILPAWSISIELLFYLIAPLLVRRSIRAQLLVVGVSFALRIFAGTVFGLTTLPWSSRFFPFEVGLFLLGSIGYRCLKHAETFAPKHRLLRPGLTFLLSAGMLLYCKIPLQPDMRHWAFLGSVALAVPLLFALTRRNTIDRWIGEISYPLYLVHNIVHYSLNPVLSRTHGLLHVVISLATPLVCAVLIYVLFERRCEAWRANFFTRRQPANDP